ncbi:MAG: hypothetical protein K2J57_01395 [Bacteroidales bacterium]|nr:hypothetical protein [Bacteroidales bacterium]
MKTIQKPFFRVLMMLLSALCLVSCKPEKPQVENWCLGEWINNERWYIGNDTVLNFEDKLTFSDKTFTLFHDTTGVWVDNISFTPRFGITRYGTYRYEQYCAYLTFSDEPENTYAASVEEGNGSMLHLHLSPTNAFIDLSTYRTFYRVKPPLPD